MRNAALVALSCFVLVSSGWAQEGEPQYVSPAGQKYYAHPDSEKKVFDAERKLSADPKKVDLIVALDAAETGIWRIREAIATCDRGLALVPDNPALVASRGHHYLTLRDLARAQTELERATKLDEKLAEPWYYLAVVHYVRGEWDEAASAWEKRIQMSKDYGDSLGATDWLYMTYRRAGREDDARRLLERVGPEQEVAGGAAIYQTRLLFYKGVKSEADVLAAMKDDVSTATLSYGLGNWYLYQASNREKAREYFEKAIASSAWVALAFIASEKELAAPK